MTPRTGKGLAMVCDALFVAILLLLFTGGLRWEGALFGRRAVLEVSQLGPWVAAYVLGVLLLARFWPGSAPRSVGLMKRVADRIDRLAAGPHAVPALLVAALSWSVWLIVIAFRRHFNLYSNAYDMGIPYQALFNTLRGEFWVSSIKGDISLFADHVQPFYFVFLPLVALLKTPLVLVVAQNVLVPTVAVPLFLVARRRTGDIRLAWTLALAWLAYLPLRNALLFDYHAEVFSALFTAWAIERWDAGKRGWAFVFFLVALSCKETLGLLTAAFGVGLLLSREHRRFGALLAATGAAHFLFCIKVVPALVGASYAYAGLYGALGGSWTQVALSPILRPAAFFGEVFDPAALRMFGELFGPVAFLCFWRTPFALPAAASFFTLALVEGAARTRISAHYGGELAPFVFFGAAFAVAGLIEKGRSAKTLFLLLVAATFLFAGRSEVMRFRKFSPDEHRTRVKAALAAIPGDAPVATSSCLVPHLLNRPRVYMAPRHLDRAQWLAIDPALCAFPMKPSEIGEFVGSLPAKGWHRVCRLDGFALYGRNANEAGDDAVCDATHPMPD
jgi:uncharacterized membrane protein